MAAVATHVRRFPRKISDQTFSKPPTGQSASGRAAPSGLTLEDLILGVWEDLKGRGGAECPVCDGSMNRHGDCASCGSHLR